jgi:hypothetical protein
LKRRLEAAGGINHLGVETGLRRAVEQGVAPIEGRAMPPFGLFSLIRAGRARMQGANGQRR